MSASRSSPRSAVAWATELELLDERADVAALAGERRERGVGVAREVGQHLVLRRQDLEDLVDLPERRVGAADDLVDLLAAAGEAGPQLGEDQREPLAVGQAHDVVDQVEVDRLLGVLDRQQVLALALAALDLAQRRRRLGVDGALLRRRALDELLADQRLRADLAAGVGAEVLVRRVLDVEHHHGLEVAGDVHRVDLADLDAGDLDVLAGDHEAGVVEDRAHLVGAAVARAGGDHHGGGDGEQEEDGRDALHQGPGSTRLGSQSSGPRLPLSVYGAEPSSVGLAGGARAALGDVGLEAVELLVEAVRHQHATGRVVGERERVEHRLDAREVAVGVVVGRPLPEVVEPAGDLGHVRADELEHGLGLLQRLPRVVERRGGDLLEAGQLARRVDQVVVGPVARDGQAQVVDRRASRSRRAGAGRAGTARGPWSRAWTRRRAGRGRRASRAG